MRRFFLKNSRAFYSMCLAVGVLMLVLLMCPAFATEGGGGGASGGDTGCDEYEGIWTCFGATWRYYKTTENSVYIVGFNQSFAQNGTVSGCGDYGGYWLYGMVCAGGSICRAGRQVGMIPIGDSGGYGSWDFLSAYFGGGMHYRGPSDDWRDAGNLEWEDVKEAYEAQSTIRGYSGVGELGWDKHSSLMWFCGPKPGDTYTLTVIAIDDDGVELGSSYNKSESITYEYWAQISEGGGSVSVTMDEIPGYRKIKWGTDKNNKNTWWADTGMTYTEEHLWKNKTVYAVFEEDQYRGLARVFEGDSTSGTNYSSTGWVEKSKTADTLNVDCSGNCNVTFNLKLKSVNGVSGGSVNYAVYKQKNGGKATLLKQDALSPSTDGESIYINDKRLFTEVLNPGDTMCYYVTFGVNAVTAKACAHANVSTFEGKLDVGNTTTEWKGVDASVTHEIAGCTISGCKVTFTHRLKRTSGVASLSYTIARTSNYWVSNKALGVEPKSPLTTGTETFATNPNAVYEETLTLMPGQVVCETLVFKPVNSASESYSDVTLKACASALGKAQPDDPSPDPSDDPNNDDESDAFVKMQVKNTSDKSADKYKKFQSVVYAKPGQTLEFRATYNPKLQYAYYLRPQRISINGGTIYPTSGANTGSYLFALFNKIKGNKLKDWNNDITVYGEKTGASSSFYTKDYSFTNGDTSKQSKSHEPMVQVPDVGKEIKETVKTNAKDETKTTASQIIFAGDGSGNKYNVADIKTVDKSSSAAAYVPYNYDTGIEVSTSADSVLNAGDTPTIRYEIVVEPRINPETTDGSDGEKYATKVPGAVSKVIVYMPTNGGEKPGTASYTGGKDQDLCTYYGLTRGEEINSNCKEIGREDEELNSSGSLSGSSTPHQRNIEVPDVPAGSKFCVAVAVYPANSGAYTNWSDVEGSHSWRISDSKCFTIGKRPTFQVWGGSFYGGGKVTVYSTAKKNIALPTGSITIDHGAIVFSSWVEQMVVAKGEVRGLASGAAPGLTANDVGGGSSENPTSFCKYRVPLSIANYGSGLCQGGATEEVTGKSGINISVADSKKAFVVIADEDEGGVTERITNKNDISNAKLGLGSGLASGTKIVEYDGNISITGDITYNDGSSYTTLEQIPKMIIYAKGANHNIYIGCAVTRIDAILLADGTIYTCGSYTGTNATVSNGEEIRNRTTQLQVNGAIFAKGLQLGRTYGMSIGIYSKIPAEIVNYDSSIVLWAKGKTGKDDFEKLHQVYINELAPRY